MLPAFRRAFSGLSTLAFTVAIGLMLQAQGPTVDSGTWTATGAMAQARSGASAVLLTNGYVLISGGITAEGVTNGVEVFDGHRFVPVSPMLIPRAGHASVTLNDGRVLVTGGRGGNA